MAKVLVTERHLQDIAGAIRGKLGVQTTYRPGDMAAAVAAIDTGYPEPTGTLPVTANGIVNVKDYASANVNVQPNLQSKTATQNGTVTADSGYDGLSSVVVNVSGGGGSTAATIAVENGNLITDGVTVKTQPVITDDQIGASASEGLTFALSETKMQIEFDLTIKSGDHIQLSFGGSNTNGGVYLIDTSRFHLYANGARFTVGISLTENVKYRIKILFAFDSATLYVDGTQIAVGQSNYVSNAITHVLKGNDIGILFNQSKHSEYSQDLIDNVVIQFVQE